jgi:TPR repeat protein
VTADTLVRDANALNPYACLAMGYYYQNGKEFDQDDHMAIVWYERAAAGGCARAHWELACMYRDADQVRDLSHYLIHVKEAARLGNKDAQVAVAHDYREGLLLKYDESQSMHWYRKAAENGDFKAMFMVGYYYNHGIGVPKSHDDAEMWFETVASTGNADIFFDIGMAYEFGMDGIIQDYDEAKRWYTYGSYMGHEKCFICLRSMIKHSKGYARESYQERLGSLIASKTQKEITMRDDALAMADEFFDAGDDKRAFTYYERAAGLGSSDAMFLIAMMYHQGIYVARNDTKALSILRKAASAGSADAQFFLGRIYDGNGMPRDVSQAIDYYTQAAYNGFLPAYYYLTKYVPHPENYVRYLMS